MLRAGLVGFREQVRARDGDTCTYPGGFGLACTGPVDVHHVLPRLVAPELRLDPENGTCLCRRHHDALQEARHVSVAYLAGLLGRAGDRVTGGRVSGR